MPIRRLLSVAPLTWLAGLALACTVADASAQQIRIEHTGPDSPARVVPRLGPGEAAYRIVTTDGRIEMALTDDAVALQFTDAGLDYALEAEPIEPGEDRALARLLHRLLHEGVRGLLNHAIEYPLWDLTDGRYEEGELRLLRRDGQALFDDVRVDDRPIMKAFEPDDAREFATRLRRALAREL